VWAYNQISLSWDATGVNWYDVEVQDGGGRWNHVRSVYDNGVDMAGFDAATTYSFRVRGVENTWPDWSYTDYSAVVTPTTSAYQAAPTFTVTDDTSWNTAYVNAEAGDVIEILPGTVLTEKTAPPWRAGPGKFVTIRSAAMSLLPGFDQRVGPSDTGNMPMFRTRQQVAGAMHVGPGSHHLSFEGIRFEADQPTQYRVNYIVVFNEAFQDVNNDPYDIEFHRCWVESPRPGTVFGATTFTECDSGFYSYGADRVVIKDTYCKELSAETQDAPSIGGTRGKEWAVNNCHLEGSMPVFWGGASHPETDVLPDLHSYRRNHIVRPTYWIPTEADYDGRSRNRKNMFEIKYGQRFLIEDNYFQRGYCTDSYVVILTPRADISWSGIYDVQIRYNHFDTIDGGFRIAGSDGLHAPPNDGFATKRLTVSHNLIEDFGKLSQLGKREYEFNTSSPEWDRLEDICFRRNSWVTDELSGLTPWFSPTNAVALWEDGFGLVGQFIYENNITCGLLGRDGGANDITVLSYVIGDNRWTFENNVMVLADSSLNNSTKFPNNYNLATGPGNSGYNMDGVGFVDWRNGNWRLHETSAHYSAQGCDNSVYDRTAHCIDGDWSA